MKLLLKLFILVFVISFASCRDANKEQEETEAIVEQIEAVESELDDMSADLEKDTQDLEDALKELDSI